MNEELLKASFIFTAAIAFLLLNYDVVAKVAGNIKKSILYSKKQSKR